MKLGRTLLLGLTLTPAGLLTAQEIGSDAPAASPLANLDQSQPPRERTVAESDGVAANVHVIQARLALGRGEQAAALRHYQRAWQWNPRQSSLLAQIVELAFQLRRNDEAARYALLAGEDDLPQPLLLRRLATHLTERRDWAGAVRLYERAQKLDKPRDEKLDLGEVLIRREMGRLYFLTSDFAKSAEAFATVRDALEDPQTPLSADAKQLVLGDAPETYGLWAEAFLAAGKLDEAEAMFRRAHEAESAQASLAFHLARVAAERGDNAFALAKLAEYFSAKSTAGGTEPYELLAKLNAKQVDDEVAARQQTTSRLEKLAAEDADNLSLRLALADQYLAAASIEKAEPLLVAVASKQTGSSATGKLAEIYRQSNRPAKLLDLAALAAAKVGSLDLLGDAAPKIAADKPLVKRLAELTREYAGEGNASLAAGLLALEAREFDLADELLAAAASRQPPPAATVLRQWGLGMLLADEPARAERVFQRVLDDKIAPADEAETWFFLSAALALADRTDEALAAARRAAELRPSDARSAARIGWVLYHGRRFAEARAAYLDFLQKFDGRHVPISTRQAVREARLTLSNIDVELGDDAAATEWLQQVLDEFPEDIGAGNDLGYLWADRGEHLQRSLALIQRAVQADPENIAYRDSLGWVFFRLNRLEEAVAELQQAAASESAPGVIHEHLGDALARLGQRAAALAAYRRAEAAFQKAGETAELASVRNKLDALTAQPQP